MIVFREPRSHVAPLLATTITARLERGETVLWLLSGGSGIQACVDASRAISATSGTLLMAVSDERYGDISHADENTKQLLDAGFDATIGELYRPLVGLDRAQTTEQFAIWLDAAHKRADYTIALMGIGADGHTSGIKPHSPAVTDERTVVDFDGEDFQRITTTAGFVRSIDEAIVQAYGEDKWPTLTKLFNTKTDVAEQPAQIIKRIPNVTVYTDLKEDYENRN